MIRPESGRCGRSLNISGWLGSMGAPMGAAGSPRSSTRPSTPRVHSRRHGHAFRYSAHPSSLSALPSAQVLSSSLATLAYPLCALPRAIQRPATTGNTPRTLRPQRASPRGLAQSQNAVAANRRPPATLIRTTTYRLRPLPGSSLARLRLSCAR